RRPGPARARGPCSPLLPVLGSQRGELLAERPVAAVDEVDAAGGGGALAAACGEQVAEAAAAVRPGDVGGVQRVRPGDDGGVVVVAAPEAAARAAQALAVHLDAGAHVVQRRGEPEPVLVDRL